jgi:hypothetical protein
LGQPAFALKPLGFRFLNHQVTAKFLRFEPSGQDELPDSGLRNAKHPRDLDCGQRINAAECNRPRRGWGDNLTG